jgi:hypothetical protein
MTPDEIDRILAGADRLEPSSGFVRNVMDAVRRQASEPPPVRFPWLRFAAGLLACGLMALAGTALLPRLETTIARVSAPLAPLAAIAPELCYAAAVLLMSLALAALPRVLSRS